MSCLVWGNVDVIEIIFFLSLWIFWFLCLKGCLVWVLLIINLLLMIWDEKVLFLKFLRILFMVFYGFLVILLVWVLIKMIGGWVKFWGFMVLWVGFWKEWIKFIYFMRWLRLDLFLVVVLIFCCLVCFVLLFVFCNKFLFKLDISRYIVLCDIKMGCKVWYRDWFVKF